MIKIILISSIFLTGCVLTEVEGVIESSTKGIATMQIADAGNKIAENRKIKAESNRIFIEKTETLISNQPIGKQAELISESIEAKVEISKYNSFTFFILGMLVSLIFVGIFKFLN